MTDADRKEIQRMVNEGVATAIRTSIKFFGIQRSLGQFEGEDLDVNEVADVAGVEAKTVRAAVRAGKLVAVEGTKPPKFNAAAVALYAMGVEPK